jgi:hypothetical protein
MGRCDGGTDAGLSYPLRLTLRAAVSRMGRSSGGAEARHGSY